MATRLRPGPPARRWHASGNARPPSPARSARGRRGGAMRAEQLHELLLQALETELGGIEIYKAGIGCAVTPELKLEWQEYLAQTRNHERVVRALLHDLGLDSEQESAGRSVVRHLGQSLLQAIELARESASPDAAQPVATECITVAETKDHQNWELIGM